jgi:hypothetical protein
MRVSTRLGSSLLCVLVLGCGRQQLDDPSGAGPAGSTGEGGSAGSAGTDAGGAGLAGATGTAGQLPAVHRSTAAACPAMMLPPDASTMCPFARAPGLEVPGGSCNSASDCTAGQDPRCVGSLPSGSCSCTYDACFSDADCPAGEVCACSGVYSGNACVGGACRIDADCGVGGFCSPEIEHCTGVVLGYFCRTPKDTCVNDADCGDAVHCARDPGTGTWGCQSLDGCPL